MHTHQTRLKEYHSDENDNKGKERLQEEIVGHRRECDTEAHPLGLYREIKENS